VLPGQLAHHVVYTVVMVLRVARLATAAAITGAAAAQGPPAAPARQDQPIRVSVDLVTTDVIVRDRSGRFVANLAKDDFEVYEDGVQQKIVSFLLSHGGRILNVAAPSTPSPGREGVILPPARPPSDVSGRLFVIFIDDFHLDPPNTPKVRHLLQQIVDELLDDGDMFAAVSTGHSSIEIPLTYDRKRLDQAIAKVMGGGLQPDEILAAPAGAQGTAELRHRAHVAFRTAWDIIQNLAKVPDRRKAFIYVSSGYDFAPFQKTRERLEAERYGGTDVNPFATERTQFSDADLAIELSELTRAANRANATIYTLDPRGLVGGPPINQQVDSVDWQNYVTRARDSLRVLADLTGGFAVVNTNDFTAALKRIDNETSDYYLLGYYSSNPDPSKRRRTLQIKVKRAGVDVHHRTEYVLPPLGSGLE
jgi:VWFA-related protein